MASNPMNAGLRSLQRLVEREMTDTCQIVREAPGPGTFNPDTNAVTIATTTVYTGPVYLADREEGAFSSGGFGGNPQEWAYDGRAAFIYFRLPLSAPQILTGDVLIYGGERFRVTATERGTTKADATYRAVIYDKDASRA